MARRNEFCDDIRIQWDWMKYKIRQESISYNNFKAKERGKRLWTIENDLKVCEKELAEAPTQENIVNLEVLKAEYGREYDYIVRGLIIRSLSFCNHSFIPKLNDEQRDLCEGQLTYAECYKVLSTFENNKTPGNDGLTIEFYKFFGQKLVRFLWIH